MPGEADAMVHIFEDIEQMSLGHALFKQRFKGFKFFGDRLRFEAFEVRFPRCVNRQFGVVRERGINSLGHVLQPFLEMVHKGLGRGRKLEGLTIGG